MADAKTKKEIFEHLLELEDVMIHLDPRRKGAVLPKRFRRKSHLLLHIGKVMPIPIPDLEVTDLGIGATLSFNRKPFHCFLPWASIYAVVGKDSSRGMIWSEDLPKEVEAAFHVQGFNPPQGPGVLN